jgi:hypothetical protein
MQILATILATLFVLLAALHVYWGFGGKAGVDRAVPEIAGRAAFRPGRMVTLLVAALLLGVAGIVYLLGFVDLARTAYGNVVVCCGWVLALIFFLRAVGDFNLVGFFKKTRDTMFAIYDTRYYSPFSLASSLAFALLAGRQM